MERLPRLAGFSSVLVILCHLPSHQPEEISGLDAGCYHPQSHGLGCQVHYQFVRNVIKETFDISIKHNLVSHFVVFHYLVYGCMTSMFFSKSMRVIMKPGIENWIYQRTDYFLCYLASDCRDTQRTEFSFAFRNINPSAIPEQS